jgi:heme-degrading monooxygenase HmoA
MFARLSLYEIPPERGEEAQAGFREAIGRIGESDGFVDAYLLRGCDTDRFGALVVWDSFDSMAASRVTASRLRTDAARSVDGDVVSVEEFEIVSRLPAGG